MLDPELTRLRLKVHLAEYQSLKNEQVHRMGLRDNLLYATLVTTAAVVAYALDPDGNPLALLILPFAYFLLGWLHTANDAKSCFIRHYLRHSLAPRLAKMVGDGTEAEGFFGWEERVRLVPLRRQRKATDLLSALLTFVAPGFFAVASYWIWFRQEEPAVGFLLGVSTLGTGLLVWLARWLWRERDMLSESAWTEIAEA